MLGAPKVKDGARLFGLRLFVRLHHFRRRHGYLLGALAHARISVGRAAAAAAGREDRARAGCHGRRLGVSVCADRHERQAQPGANCGRCRTGFCAISCSPCRAWRKWRRWAASSGSTRSTSIPTKLQAYNIPIIESGGGGARRQQRCRRPAGGDSAAREYMVRGRGYAQVDGRHRQHRAERISAAACRSACGMSGSVALGPGYAARHRRSGTAQGEAVSGIVVMRQGENALEVIERVKAKLQGDRAGAAAGREDGHRLRPLGADPALDRQPEAHADRRVDHRRARDPDFPVALSRARSFRCSPFRSRS